MHGPDDYYYLYEMYWHDIVFGGCIHYIHNSSGGTFEDANYKTRPGVFTQGVYAKYTVASGTPPTNYNYHVMFGYLYVIGANSFSTKEYNSATKFLGSHGALH